MYNIDVSDLKYRLSCASEETAIKAHYESSLAHHYHFKKYNWMLHFTAGAISGPVSRTITAPFDRMRLEMQVAPAKQTMYGCWMAIYSRHGIRGFWKGNGINVAKIAAEMAIRFGVFDSIKSYIARGDGNPLTLTQRFISGSIAGVCGQVLIYPSEVMKSRIMMNKGEFRNVHHAVITMLRYEGFIAFYRGYLASVIGMIPYTGVDLTVYELLKTRFIYPTLEANQRAPAWKYLLCASASITCGQFAAYPFYLIKARQQTRSTHPAMRSNNPAKIFVATLKHDGVLGLYRGIALTLFKVLPAGIINYYVYEVAKRRLAPFFESEND